ncbi:MAG: energy-coupling factor transporter transmembrane protein EcfT [Clostridiales bacterium]|jgi:energy-coupling factor transport system permease protein|nr:energy-coupling factor transporter transmembrane protein EcfT [Clostridiales bacterium]
MLKNITIGQYYPIDSFIHRLDARVKLLAVFVYVVMLFVVGGFLSYAFAVACLCAVIYISKVPPWYMLRGLKGILVMIIFTAVVNVFFTPGATVLFRFWAVTVTAEGVATAVQMTLRLALLIVGSSVLTLTTSSIQLTDAIEFILAPFKKIGVPSHEIAMMMTIALRFIPTLLEEMDKIMKAQSARGADFDTGGLIKKAKSLVPLLVPLFISAFRRADELASAMEARCYRGDDHRTKMKESHLYKNDYLSMALIGMFVAVSHGINRIPGF